MDLRIAGPAWDEEHDDLVQMAHILQVAVRVSALARPAGPSPLGRSLSRRTPSPSS